MRWLFCIAVLFGTLTAPAAQAQSKGPTKKETQEMVDKAVAFLKKSQSPDGGFSARFAGPGVTALVVVGLLRNGVSPEEPVVKNALKAIESYAKDDGGIYTRRLANYTTCVSILALKEANVKGKYDTMLKDASKFLRGLQFGDDIKPEDPRYGGAGYDGKSRPDMSNTQFLVEAMIQAGVDKKDPAIQRALKFITRCQNLPSDEGNDQAFAKKTTEADKGGLTYTPFDAEKSRHRTAEGGLRSLGAMTYAGLKSFLYAGVDKKDPRVQAALSWIRKNYTLEENPGMGKAGLYYYYHTFGKAMDALGEETFTDAAGKKHDWRAELFAALKKRQQADGSWVNKGDRVFGEGDPNLATAFALICASYCNK